MNQVIKLNVRNSARVFLFFFFFTSLPNMYALCEANTLD